MDEAELNRLLWQLGEEAWYEGNAIVTETARLWNVKRRETAQKIAVEVKRLHAEVARLKKGEK